MHSSHLLLALLVLAVLTVITRTDDATVTRLTLTPPAGQLMRISWANGTYPVSQPLLFTRDVYGDALPFVTNKLFPRNEYMNVLPLNQSLWNVTDYTNIMSGITRTKHSLENTFDAYLKSPSLSNQTNTHKEMLMESLFNMSKALANVGLTHQCSSGPSKDFTDAIMKTIDQMFLDESVLERSRTIDKINSESIQQPSIITWFRQKLHTINKDKKKQCREKLNGLKASQDYFKTLIRNLDDDLILFLAEKISPILSVVHNFDNGHLHLHETLQNFCTVNYEFIGENDPSYCGSKLKAIVNQTGLLQNHSPAEHSSPQRQKRFSERSISTEVNRDGYGGDSHHNSANYVVVPNSGSDDSHVYLLKLLVGWALGAYALLGLLAYRAYFISNVTGIPGPAGTSGVTGGQGYKGIKGMIGPKGIKGVKVNGDPGMKGLKGTKGTTGTAGVVGPPGLSVPGSIGSPGPTGPTGATGATGPIGPTGATGIQGAIGAVGPTGKKRRRRRNVSVNLLDSPLLLNKMYDIKDTVAASPPSGSKSQSDFIVNAVNTLWRSKQSKKGCVECSLFQFLNDQRHIDLDSYIIAGFSQILDSSGSFQLLNDVREGKKRGSKMRCRRQSNTCHLVHLGNH